MAMASSSTEESWFVSAMVKATSDMWQKGWDERNGGNVTLRLTSRDVEPYLSSWQGRRVLPLTTAIPALAGQYYLATGSGKYFRNIQIDPRGNLCIFRILPDGKAFEILWGLEDGGVPTSELQSHLQSHFVRQRCTGKEHTVIMHCHATNLLALSYALQFDAANVTRALWEGSTECLVVFPEGVGTVGWMVPGTDAIGDATAKLMAKHTMVLWQFHGVFGSGETLDEAFGLIDTAEKSAEVLVKVLAMGGLRQTISTENFVALAARFGVTPYAPALALDRWRLAEPSVADPVAPRRAAG